MGLPSLSVPNCLGQNVVQSAALFEAGVAAIINTEAEKLQYLLAKCVPTTVLINTNNQVKDIVCCLKDLENAIVTKIEIGKDMMNH